MGRGVLRLGHSGLAQYESLSGRFFDRVAESTNWLKLNGSLDMIAKN